MTTKAPQFTQNRELSWLRFNERVLAEAMDNSVPLWERLKFVSIFNNNLDEFFMIRVGSLFELDNLDPSAIDSKSGMTPMAQIDAIYEAVRPMYRQREEIFSDIEMQLRAHGICQLAYAELSPSEQKFVRQYFKTAMLPLLSPQIVDTHHPFPHLQNKAVYIGASLKRKNKTMFSIIPIPQGLPDVLVLPSGVLRYIRIENILLEFVGQVFLTYEILEKMHISLIRNADIHPDDEPMDLNFDFRKKMKKVLKQRRRMSAVRMDLSEPVTEELRAYLCHNMALGPEQVFVSSVPMKLDYAMSLSARLSPDLQNLLLYPPFSPQPSADIIPNMSILSQVQKRDLLLSFPFESMEPFLQMLKEAAHDPHVISIKITIYRLSSKAKLVEYLCAAAENGKEVVVLIELRARFDEQNNIDWSERLEEAGCRIIYGFEDYKVHSKICLITRRERNEIRHITQIGTGNYNEKTATLYTDLSLLTADQRIGEEANDFFKNMGIGNLRADYQHLLVAPLSFKARVLTLMDEEIEKGEEGKIFLKVNSVTDLEVINKLKEASCAGVRIEMIVRGICCLLPGIPNQTENIHITSIVGRYLEHSRIFSFGMGDERKMFISSADLMTRNMERRVEIAAPIYDKAIKAKIAGLMQIAARDTIKARLVTADGSYTKKQESEDLFDSQRALMDIALSQRPQRAPKESGFSAFFTRIKHWFSR